MPVEAASSKQIANYDDYVAPFWGGRDKLKELFSQSLDYERAYIDAIRGRYQGTLSTLVPWATRHIPDLAFRHLFEVGCGTGSSTAAFATATASITAWDVAEADVKLANKRLESFGCINAKASAGDFSLILNQLENAKSVDGVLLFAVLEHMYVRERIEVLGIAWNKLPPGGVIIICETPNRLSYFDAHTFRQPFVNMLPPDLARLCVDKCTNDAIRDELSRIPEDDFMAIRDRLTRVGYNGPSYHEFEIAIGQQVHGCVLSLPEDPELRSTVRDFDYEHNLLMQAFHARAPHVHPVFAMPIMYMILRKPE